MNYIISINPMKSFLFCIFICAKICAIQSSNNCTINKYEQIETVISKCTNILIQNVTVPSGVTLTLNLLEGTKLTFDGQILFGFYEWKGPLLRISGKNILVNQEPGSIIDGNGQLYWDGSGDGGILKPRLFFIDHVTGDSQFNNIHLKNCPVQCVHIVNSSDVVLDGWLIDVSDGDEDKVKHGKFAHNTDGFDVDQTTNLIIKNANVHNHDDCVCINKGSNLTFQNIFCYGSHGLSLAVGLSNTDATENEVSDVYFRDSVVVNGLNGIHVKTLPEAAKGFIRNVHYENIFMSGCSDYGINIEQDYVGGGGNGNPLGNIVISEFYLNNITGNVNASAVPVYILCGDGGCSNWTWSNVEVKSSTKIDECNFIPTGYTC